MDNKGETKKKKRRLGRIRNKLLFFIMPTAILLVAALVIITMVISSQNLEKKSKSELESSMSNQADNITAWMDKSLQSYATAKKQIESNNLTPEELQNTLDSFYGYFKNSPDGLYVITSGGKFYKAQNSTKELKDPANSTEFKQGLQKVDMDYGTPYKDENNRYVVTASGIIDSDTEDVEVLAADVYLDYLNIIVNSGVKMEGASAFLLDFSTWNILSHQDVSLISTKLDDKNADPFLAEIYKTIRAHKFDTCKIAGKIVGFKLLDNADWILVSYIDENKILADVIKLRNIMLIIGLIAIVIMVLLTIRIVNSVIAPLTPMSRYIKDMSEGDFTINVETHSNDEIGVMGDQLKDFVENMKNMISSIFKASEKLKDESIRSDEVSKTMSDASNSQAEAMRKLNTTVDQLAVAANGIAENASVLASIVSETRKNSNKADQSMQETVRMSQKGKDDMEQLRVAMEEIYNSNEKLVSSIGKVGEASDQIVNIVALIGNISEETNLLSLNASIEAARAGEAGKGFAVVATEIGKLAQTSTESSQHIADLIEEVRGLIANVVQQSDENAKNIQKNTELIVTAVETFENIFKNIQVSNNLMSDMIHEISRVSDVAASVATISEEQAASADEILSASKDMVVQAENISKSSHDVAENSHELAYTSDILASYVQRFKI